jgi:hypothetical protein
MIDEEKEELLVTGIKNYPLNQHQRFYRKKRCWLCKNWSHKKE